MTERNCKRTLMVIVSIAAMGNWLFAASSMIGVAMADGSFRLNANSVTGSATVFDGSILETGKASSDIRLQSGAIVRLYSDSRGRLYQGRMILEKGRMEVAGGYVAEVLGLRVEAAGSGTAARIGLEGA